LPLFLECRIEGASALTRLSDLSVSGCYVDTRMPIPVGSLVTVEVTLAGFPMTLTGRVAHTHVGNGFGLQFDPLPPEHQQRIAQFLDSLQYPPN
jgi:hypothetical protein